MYKNTWPAFLAICASAYQPAKYVSFKSGEPGNNSLSLVANYNTGFTDKNYVNCLNGPFNAQQ